MSATGQKRTCYVVGDANAFPKLKRARCGPSTNGSGCIRVGGSLAGGPMVTCYPWNPFNRIEPCGGPRGLQVFASCRVERLFTERARAMRGRPFALELRARPQWPIASVTRNPGH
jgi:hypothetical protein